MTAVTWEGGAGSILADNTIAVYHPQRTSETILSQASKL